MNAHEAADLQDRLSNSSWDLTTSTASTLTKFTQTALSRAYTFGEVLEKGTSNYLGNWKGLSFSRMEEIVGLHNDIGKGIGKEIRQLAANADAKTR